MNKQFIKKLIVEQQEFIRDVNFIERPLQLEENCNYVFTGIRRARKSYIMFQIAHQLVKTRGLGFEDILYVNFEDDRLLNANVDIFDAFIDSYKELYNRKPIVFLDEIQIVVGWEKFARRLADQKYQVFITGSNAQMLSKEIYTTSRSIFTFLTRKRRYKCLIVFTMNLLSLVKRGHCSNFPICTI